jgi:ClpP class serine protease
MGLSILFMLFIFFAVLQPVLKQRMLESARQKLIASVEKKRGSRLILLVHRQETMSLLGFPVFKYINIEDSEDIIRAIHMTDRNLPIDLVLHTPGGLVLASYQIAHAIKDRPGKVTVHVPHYAMSGGTLIALAADEIVMGEHAVLGPVDPQVGEYPAASLLRVLETKSIADIDDRTIIYADIAKKAVDQLREMLGMMLSEHFSRDHADTLIRTLTQGKWTHDFPITYEQASELGLRVNKGLPEELYQLMSLYRQPIKRHPTVDYIPHPKFNDGQKAERR